MSHRSETVSSWPTTESLRLLEPALKTRTLPAARQRRCHRSPGTAIARPPVVLALRGGLTAAGRSVAAPCPLRDLGHVLAVGDNPLAMPGTAVDHLLAEHSRTRTEPGHPVDHVHHQVEPVHVVQHEHVERGRRRSLFQVAPDVQVVVAVTAVGQPVYQRRIAVIGEDHRLVRGEQGVVLRVAHPVRVLCIRLQAHQIDHVHHSDPQIRQMLAEDVRGGEHLDGRHVPRTGEHDVRFCLLLGVAAVVARPGPDPRAACAVQDRVVDVQPLRRRVLAGDDHVDVVAAAQAVVCDRQQAVGIWR